MAEELPSPHRSTQIWDAKTRRKTGEPMRHTGPIEDVEFSPDGRFILSVSADGTARVWDAHNGDPVSDPLRHDQQIVSGEWARGGDRVLTAYYDRTARLWPLHLWPESSAPGWLPDLAEAVGGLRLTVSGTYSHVPIDEVIEQRTKLAAMDEGDRPATG